MFVAILKCAGRSKAADPVSTEKTQANKAEPAQPSRDVQRANEIIGAMWDAEKTGEDLRMRVTGLVKINNWTESLAKAVLARLDDAIKVSLLISNLRK